MGSSLAKGLRCTPHGVDRKDLASKKIADAEKKDKLWNPDL